MLGLCLLCTCSLITCDLHRGRIFRANTSFDLGTGDAFANEDLKLAQALAQCLMRGRLCEQHSMAQQQHKWDRVIAKLDKVAKVSTVVACVVLAC